MWDLFHRPLLLLHLLLERDATSTVKINYGQSPAGIVNELEDLL